MTEKPTGRGPSQRSGARAAEDRRLDQKDEAAETYGLVVLARHVKDDGRALITYTRAEDVPE